MILVNRPQNSTTNGIYISYVFVPLPSLVQYNTYIPLLRTTYIIRMYYFKHNFNYGNILIMIIINIYCSKYRDSHIEITIMRFCNRTITLKIHYKNIGIL